MFNHYINEKITEKLEYDLNLFKEYLIIYINLLVKFPNEFKVRNKLTTFIKNYYSYAKCEYQLLTRIKKINNKSLEEECITILEEIENIFKRQFYYNEDLLNGYEESIFYDDITRAIVMDKKFDNLEIINNYIKKLNN